MKYLKRYVHLAIASTVLTAILCFASISPAQAEGLRNAMLRPGWLASDGSYYTALDLTLSKGWKTYWRSPGEYGYPPKIEYDGSSNLQKAEPIWPAPIIFGSENMETIGYAEHLVLPIKLTPVDAAHPIKLELSAQLGICLDICVPIFLSLSQQLDPVQRSADPATLLALENQPVPRALSNLQYLDCAVTPDEDAILITIGAAIPSLGARETLIIEYKQQNHWVMMEPTRREGPLLQALGYLTDETGAAPLSISRQKIQITVIGSLGAADLGDCTAQPK